jgi:hypothetical protein
MVRKPAPKHPAKTDHLGHQVQSRTATSTSAGRRSLRPSVQGSANAVVLTIPATICAESIIIPLAACRVSISSLRRFTSVLGDDPIMSLVHVDCIALQLSIDAHPIVVGDAWPRRACGHRPAVAGDLWTFSRPIRFIRIK